MPNTADDYRQMKNSAKKKYTEAYAQREAYRRQEADCRAAQKVAQQNWITGNMQKINFEKRIQDIERIVRMIEDMDRQISNANQKAQETDEAYSKCIHCDGYSSASFADTFKVKSVHEDSDIVSAIDKLKNEKARLERELENLRKEIAANQQMVFDLQKQINTCAVGSAQCSARMATKSFEMSYYDVQIRRLT